MFLFCWYKFCFIFVYFLLFMLHQIALLTSRRFLHSSDLKLICFFFSHSDTLLKQSILWVCLAWLFDWLSAVPHTHTRTRLLSLSVYGKQRLFGNVSSYDSGPLTWDIDAHELSFLLFGSNQTYLFRLHSRLIRFLIVFIYVGNIVVCFFPSFIFHLLCFILSSNHVCCSFLSLKIAPFFIILFYSGLFTRMFCY